MIAFRIIGIAILSTLSTPARPRAPVSVETISARGGTTSKLVLIACQAPLFRRPQDTEWPSYTADLAGTRYRPLDQINAPTSASSKSRGASRPTTSAIAPEFKLEGTPLMVNGVLYATGGIAARRWSRSMRPRANCSGCTASTKARAARAAPRQLSGRGLAYWTDGKDERILYVTPGYRLIALDAKTGAPVPASARTAWSI